MLSAYFSVYLPQTKGLSSNTIVSYQYAFQLLFEFLLHKKGLPPEKVSFACLSEDVLLEYLHWLEAERGCSAASRNLRRSALSSFAKYAVRSPLGEALAFYSAVSSIPKKRTPQKPEIKYFTKEEVSILLSLPDTSTKIGRRNAVLMSVLYASGARAQELCDMTLTDISFGNPTSIRLSGKGNKARIVTIPENCSSLLSSYLKSVYLDPACAQDRRRHVFSSQTHEKMSISCVEEIVAKYVAQAKAAHPQCFKSARYSPHSFRHSIAVHMLECGESLVVIKAFLGHASISTTTVYASVTPELASKYLRERGLPLESVNAQQQKREAIVATLPFLARIHTAL